MKLTNRKVELALNALQILKRSHPKRMLRVEIANALGESEFFIHAVLTILSRNKYVHATRGPIGGYAYNLKSDTVTVKDLLNCFSISLISNPTRAGSSASERLTRHFSSSLSIKLSELIS